MTKEELKQETEEYGIDLCAYCRECEGEKPCQHKIDAMHGYQDGLKAREKRIEELEKELEFEKSVNGEFTAIEKLREPEKENEELKADNDARKFAMAMSEKVEKQLREENAELKNRDCWKSCEYANPKSELIAQHIKDVQQLTKAKKLLKKVVTDFHNMDCVSVHIDKTIPEAEQFLKDSEVEK